MRDSLVIFCFLHRGSQGGKYCSSQCCASVRRNLGIDDRSQSACSLHTRTYYRYVVLRMAGDRAAVVARERKHE